MVGATRAGRDRTWKAEREINRGQHAQKGSGGKKAHPALNILLSAPEAVLKQNVEDAAETKRRFDDVRRKFADCMQGGQMTLHPGDKCVRWTHRIV